MPVIADKFIEIQDLSKGMNTYDPISRVPAGYYVDAQNMLLTNKAPTTIAGLTKFNTTAAPNSETIVWCEPYTSGSPAVTTLLVATDAGTLYKYNVTTDVWETLRTGLSTTAFTWTHVPFRGSLLFSNGTDAIMKYNGTNVLPVGSVLAADMEADETWTGTNESVVSTILAQRREGLRSMKIFSVGNALKAYGAAQDFQAGINGAPNFGGTDLFKMQVFKAAGSSTGTVRIRFADFTTQATKYFEKSVTVSADGWSTISFAISTFTNTGTAVWTNIGFFQIFVDSGDFFVFDDAYFIYNLAPPVGGLIDLYNQQLMVSGIAADLVAMQYSDAGYMSVEVEFNPVVGEDVGYLKQWIDATLFFEDVEEDMLFLPSFEDASFPLAYNLDSGVNFEHVVPVTQNFAYNKHLQFGFSTTPQDGTGHWSLLGVTFRYRTASETFRQ